MESSLKKQEQEFKAGQMAFPVYLGTMYLWEHRKNLVGCLSFRNSLSRGHTQSTLTSPPVSVFQISLR